MSADTINIALFGIGNRALPKKPEGSNFAGWVQQIQDCPGINLVCAQDVAAEGRDRIISRNLLSEDHVYEDVDVMLANEALDAVLVCTPAQFHADGVERAVQHGLHLLVEKPFVVDLDQGKRLLELVEKSGVVSTVVQNWRYKDVGRRMRDFVASGELGRVGNIFFRYVRNRENPNYPPYIFEEAYPLLYAMGSHHFDLFRFILGDEITEVTGTSFRPPWSMYKSWTGHSIDMRTAGGVFISYSASISSMNSGLPQESIVVEGDNGTLVNNSDWSEPPLLFYPKGEKVPVDLTSNISGRSEREQYDVADAVILRDFVEAIQGDRKSDCPAEDSYKSLVLVEACRQACESGECVKLV